MTSKSPVFENVQPGDKLPPREIPITAGLIVGGAIASRDFTPVHHDRSAAQKIGLPDIFMNILTSNGLMGSYVTTWAGPDSTTKKIDLQLAAPNLPGFIMTLTGEVKSVNASDASVEIEVVGENNVWGMHMRGIVQVQLPRGE